MSTDDRNELDEFQKAWQADSDDMRAKIDYRSLADNARHRSENLRATVFWRDFREVVAAVVMIPVWIVLGVKLDLPWTWYLTLPALIWVIGFVLVDRKRHPQHADDIDAPLLDSLKRSLDQVAHQMWLLRNVFWWYLLPFTLSMLAFFFQVAWDSSQTWWGFLFTAGAVAIFVAVVYIPIYRLNQRAVRTELQPQFDAIFDLIAAFEGHRPTGDVNEAEVELEQRPTLISWSGTWNGLVPSWSVAGRILLVTLIGLGGGWLIPDDGSMPRNFEEVVGAVIGFELIFGWTYWRWVRNRKRVSVLSVTSDNRNLPKAPALFVLALLFLVSGYAFAVVYQAASQGQRQPAGELPDVSRFDASAVNRIDGWLEAMTASFYPSLSVAIVRDGKIVYSEAFGFSDVAEGREATTETMYHVASVTKVFTATLAAILHEQGTIDLDAPLAAYLPNSVRISATPEIGQRITLRALANHTSGLPRGVPGPVQSVEGYYQLEPKRLYELLARVELQSPPGTQEHYSNLGYGLLGHALELAANQPFDELIAEKVCRPMGLEHTAIQSDVHMQPATGYGHYSRSQRPQSHTFQTRLAASGGLVTTAEDLGRFLIAQMEPGVISDSVRSELHASAKLTDGSKTAHGLAWSIDSSETIGRVFSKNGGRNNCTAWIGFAPEHRVGVAVVSNCGGPDVDPVGKQLLDQSIPKSQQRLVSGDQFAKVAPFTGVCWNDGLPTVRVDGKWRRLIAINGLPVEQILAFAEDEFALKARKRFTEDIVQTLTKMGHQPTWDVTLELKNPDGSMERKSVTMTAANRREARDHALAASIEGACP